jgi:hypothetical protein
VASDSSVALTKKVLVSTNMYSVDIKPKPGFVRVFGQLPTGEIFTAVTNNTTKGSLRAEAVFTLEDLFTGMTLMLSEDPEAKKMTKVGRVALAFGLLALNASMKAADQKEPQT